MTVRRIVAADDPAIVKIGRIYEASISASERKPIAWIAEAVARPDFVVLVAEAHGVTLGFATVFDPSGSTALLEYLAVDETHRGTGVGSLLFNAAVTVVSPRPVLIEVDTPHDDLSQQRLEFYVRCGCGLIDGLTYLLPLSTNPPPMRLMKYPATAVILPNWLRRSIEQIYVHVYKQPADDCRIKSMMDEFLSTNLSEPEA